MKIKCLKNLITCGDTQSYKVFNNALDVKKLFNLGKHYIVKVSKTIKNEFWIYVLSVYFVYWKIATHRMGTNSEYFVF